MVVPIAHQSEVYNTKGWVTVPLDPQSKKPSVPEWTSRTLCDPDLSSGFKKYSNIGIVLGKPSGGLVDIDLDCVEAIRMADRFLPRTGMIFGRESAPNSHWEYQVEESGKSLQYSSTDHGILVEYRATGGQTMFPPSIHPDGVSVIK